MFTHTKFWAFLSVAALLSAVAYAQRAPVKGDDPIQLTKAMYADLLCVAASEFDPYQGGFEFNYDPPSDTVQVIYLARTNLGGSTNTKNRDLAKEEATHKASLRERVDRRMSLVLPKLQKNVSPAAVSALSGF